MHAEIIMVGTELLLGEIVDTNANRLAKALRLIGLDLFYKTTVGDNEARITEVIDRALDRCDVVITSGGIGPTVDDITRQAVANAIGRELVYSLDLEAQIAARFRSFGREMADNNRRQAYLPKGAMPLPNPVGTAPCYLAEDSRGRGIVISLPGVPRELEHMLEHTVLPLLVERMGGQRVTRVRVLRTCAVGESNIDHVIGDLMKLSNPTVGLAAHVGQTDVRITAKADTEAEADKLIAPVEAELRQRLGVAIYGVDKETVADVVGAMLRERHLELVVYDEITKGQIVRTMSEAGFGSWVTEHPVAAPSSTADGIHREAPHDAVEALVESLTPSDGLGLVLAGPFRGNATQIAVHSSDGESLSQSGRHYQASDYALRWLVIQALDCVRRVLVGQFSSAADWASEPTA